MTKRHRQTNVIAGNDGRPRSFQQQEIYDDNILPNPIELEKYKEIDPTLISFLKERATNEQDARLDFNDRQMGVVEKSGRRNFLINMYAITCALIVIVLGMGLSYLFITNNLPVQGTIFGGAVIYFAARAFLNHGKPQTPHK